MASLGRVHILTGRMIHWSASCIEGGTGLRIVKKDSGSFFGNGSERISRLLVPAHSYV